MLVGSVKCWVGSFGFDSHTYNRLQQLLADMHFQATIPTYKEDQSTVLDDFLPHFQFAEHALLLALCLCSAAAV